MYVLAYIVYVVIVEVPRLCAFLIKTAAALLLHFQKRMTVEFLFWIRQKMQKSLR